MTLVRYEPWRLVNRLHQQLDNVFGDTFEGLSIGAGDWRSPVGLFGDRNGVMRRAAGPDPQRARQQAFCRFVEAGPMPRRHPRPIVPPPLHPAPAHRHCPRCRRHLHPDPPHDTPVRNPIATAIAQGPGHALD